MDWTEERVEALKTFWLEGNTAKEISRVLGVSRNAVIGKVHRLRLGGRQSPAAPRSVAGQTPRRTRARASVVAPVKPAVRAQPTRRRYVESAEFSPTAQLLTLGGHSCRWPIGHPDEAEFGFCGRQRAGAGPYCAHHRQFAYRAPSRSASDVNRLAAIR
jgi:GcrA cell cycle regulator